MTAVPQVKLYRTMPLQQSAPPLLPRCCDEGLGVRVPRDVTVDGDNVVHPNNTPKKAKGMSVVPNDPKLMRPHFWSVDIGGLNPDPLFYTSADKIVPDLTYVATSATHGVIAPIVSMHIDAYRKLLHQTSPLWRCYRVS